MSVIKKCKKKCGECCKWWVYFEKVRELTPEWIERVKVAGIRIYEIYVKNKKEYCYFVPHKCPQLKNNLCKIQDKKPIMCFTFPDDTLSYILPDCCIHINPKKNRYSWNTFKRII